MKDNPNFDTYDIFRFKLSLYSTILFLICIASVTCALNLPPSYETIDREENFRNLIPNENIPIKSQSQRKEFAEKRQLRKAESKAIREKQERKFSK